MSINVNQRGYFEARFAITIAHVIIGHTQWVLVDSRYFFIKNKRALLLKREHMPPKWLIFRSSFLTTIETVSAHLWKPFIYNIQLNECDGISLSCQSDSGMEYQWEDGYLNILPVLALTPEVQVSYQSWSTCDFSKGPRYSLCWWLLLAKQNEGQGAVSLEHEHIACFFSWFWQVSLIC